MNLLVHVPTPFSMPQSPNASMAMPSISLPKEINSQERRFNGRLKTAIPGPVAGAYLNDIAFNQPGWNEVLLTLNEIGCTAEVLDSIFVESPPDLASFDVDIFPPMDVSH
jgi:hypothetical protein